MMWYECQWMPWLRGCRHSRRRACCHHQPNRTASVLDARAPRRLPPKRHWRRRSSSRHATSYRIHICHCLRIETNAPAYHAHTTRVDMENIWDRNGLWTTYRAAVWIVSSELSVEASHTKHTVHIVQDIHYEEKLVLMHKNAHTENAGAYIPEDTAKRQPRHTNATPHKIIRQHTLTMNNELTCPGTLVAHLIEAKPKHISHTKSSCLIEPRQTATP